MRAIGEVRRYTFGVECKRSKSGVWWLNEFCALDEPGHDQMFALIFFRVTESQNSTRLTVNETSWDKKRFLFARSILVDPRMPS
jgi:hypothetical protein